MELIKIVLKNSKGMQEFTVNPVAGSTELLSTNGKSTLFDAFLWLLFDKVSDNQKDASTKKVNEDMFIVRELEYEVEAVFGTNDELVTYRKVCFKQWIQKRETVFKRFKGYTTDYFIDGVPVNKNEYISGISFIGDEKRFKLFVPPPTNKQA